MNRRRNWYELNPVTIDSTYAKAFAAQRQDGVSPNENIGRFAPIYALSNTAPYNDYYVVSATNPPANPPQPSPYQFAFQLFDYLTTNAPVDWTPNALNATWQGSSIATYAPDSANFPNVDPNPSNQFGVPAYPGPSPQPVTDRQGISPQSHEPHRRHHPARRLDQYQHRPLARAGDASHVRRSP